MEASIISDIESVKSLIISIENKIRQLNGSAAKENQTKSAPELEQKDLNNNVNKIFEKNEYPKYTFHSEHLIITQFDSGRGEHDTHINKGEFLSVVDFVIENMDSKGVFRGTSSEHETLPTYKVTAIRNFLVHSDLLPRKTTKRYISVDKPSFKDKCVKIWEIMKNRK